MIWNHIQIIQMRSWLNCCFYMILSDRYVIYHLFVMSITFALCVNEPTIAEQRIFDLFQHKVLWFIWFNGFSEFLLFFYILFIFPNAFLLRWPLNGNFLIACASFSRYFYFSVSRRKWMMFFVVLRFLLLRTVCYVWKYACFFLLSHIECVKLSSAKFCTSKYVISVSPSAFCEND